MNFYVMTLFPELIENAAKESILGRAEKAGYISVTAVNFRDYSKDRHRHVDDYTYGGGAGMLIKPEPVYDCYEDLAKKIGHRLHTGNGFGTGPGRGPYPSLRPL